MVIPFVLGHGVWRMGDISYPGDGKTSLKRQEGNREILHLSRILLQPGTYLRLCVLNYYSQFLGKRTIQYPWLVLLLSYKHLIGW